MEHGVSPTLRLWQLAESLRGHRERTGLTIEETARRLRERSPRWSRSKVQRIETRLYAPQPAEVEHLAAVYGIAADESAVLITMAREAKQRGWWQSTPIPGELRTYVGLEQAATTIRQWELALVPGLLQTSDYTRALFAGIEPTTPIELAENRIATRMIRQQVLKRDEPVEYQVVLSEAVLRSTVGDRRVMRGQLERLADTAEQPHVTIQVVHFAAGAHPGMEGGFTLLTLPQLATDIGHAEVQGEIFYVEDRDAVRRCTVRFGMVSSLALSPSDSLALISTMLAGYQ